MHGANLEARRVEAQQALTRTKELAFDEYRRGLNVEALWLGVFQATVCQPPVMLYEWFAIRPHFLQIQLMRLLFLVPVWVGGWLIYRKKPFVKRYIDHLSFWLMLPASWFVVSVSFLDTGYSSTYVFFVVLMFAGVGVVTLWPLRYSLKFYFVVNITYLVPLLFGARPASWPTMWLNFLILVSASVLVMSAQQKRLRLTREVYFERHASNWPDLGLPSHIGRYEVLTRLGIGGMAETFIGRAVGPGKFEQRVCIKSILPGFRQEPKFQSLFMEEARITASLQHSNIVKVMDFGHDPSTEILYLALELVEGADLREVLRNQLGRRLPYHVVTVIATDLAGALYYAHRHEHEDEDGRARKGVVHRDISPSNVLVSRHGEVKVTDFGIAKELRTEESKLSTGFKGKLVYMSPEQLRGDKLDGRSDLFSLGVLLHECLAGVRPFDAESDLGTVRAIMQGKRHPLKDLCLPDVPPALVDAIELLLQPKREQRCPNAETFLERLAPINPTPADRMALAQIVKMISPRGQEPPTERMPKPVG